MPDTNLQTDVVATDEHASVVKNPELEATTDVETLELELELEEGLIIEDFTIDGICGVY